MLAHRMMMRNFKKGEGGGSGEWDNIPEIFTGYSKIFSDTYAFISTTNEITIAQIRAIFTKSLYYAVFIPDDEIYPNIYGIRLNKKGAPSRGGLDLVPLETRFLQWRVQSDKMIITISFNSITDISQLNYQGILLFRENSLDGEVVGIWKMRPN